VTDGGGGGGGGNGIHGLMIRLEFRAIIGPLIDVDTGKNKYCTRRRSPLSQ